MNTSVLHLQRIFAFEKTRPRGIKPILIEDLRIKLHIITGPSYLDKNNLSFLRCLLVSFLADFVILVNYSLDFLLGSNTFTNKLLAVDFQHIWVFLYEIYFKY